MFEMIEVFLTTTSILRVIDEVAKLSVTDMALLFLLSKPVFVIIALGAVLSGRRQGEDKDVYVPQFEWNR